MTTTVDLPDEAATRRLGESLGRLCEPGDVVLLEGDLGAGKTTLVQGLAAGLGVEGDVTSPTFALLHELSGRVPLRHMDLYRLDEAHLAHLGLEEWFEPDAVIAVEWAERLGPFAPRQALHIVLTHAGDGRRAEIRGESSRYAHLVERIAGQPGRRP
ncbi:MAG: tRNA (adenosine(37)-N6)-threonylcarbamoyltransferase complex ATPase subunit type 1 TsaE [Candidatus Sericytochromatia bacterium]|nr:tRNA (adenosine(37)-N6)-threonylcarbamoyltransferase complex ATPase subunit type 1 TsaE [Candidatus Tanganyikabacteria bacterium]